MSSHVNSRREYVVAKFAVRKLKRAMRDFRRSLLAETDPIAYYSILADIVFAQAQLDEFCAQMGEWEMRSGCFVPQARTGR